MHDPADVGIHLNAPHAVVAPKGALSYCLDACGVRPVKIVDKEISDSQAAKLTSVSYDMASSKRMKNSSITSAGTRSPIASWGR